MTAKSSCAHLVAIKTIKHEKRHECEECIKTGDSWVHLRTCQTCGATMLRQLAQPPCLPARAGKRASRDRLGRAGGTLAVLLS